MTEDRETEEKTARHTLDRIWAFMGSLDWFPVFKVLRHYSMDKLPGDARAGLNVALLAFPQAMAYALIAGIPIQYGIFGSAVAAICGAIFSRSRFVALGPTNATAVLLLLTFEGLRLSQDDRIIYLPIIVAMAGIFLIIGAYLRVASLIQFISRTVVTGYITAAALYIIANQIRTAFGFSFGPDEKPESFVEVLYFTSKHIPDASWAAVWMSVFTFVLYFCLKRYAKGLPNVAIALVVGSVVALGFRYAGWDMQYLDAINAAAWPVSLPALDFGIMSTTFTAALTIALLSVLEGMSIGKNLAAKAGSRLNTNQEMFSMGMANLGNSVFSGMPASGSLTRSVLNVESGAKTSLASLISGLLIVLGAFVLGGAVQFIPRPVLAVIVIFIGISLINVSHIRMVVKSRRDDAVVFFVTLITGLVLKLDIAIYLGAAVSIALFLRQVARPEFSEYAFSDTGELKVLNNRGRPIQEISIVHVEGDIFFGAAELFRDQMRRISNDPNLQIIILKMRNAHHLDASAMLSLNELITIMNSAGRYLIVCEASPDTMRVIRNSGVIDLLEERNLIPDDLDNPTLSAAKALRRARDQMGEWADKASVSVYVGDKEFKA